MLELFVHLSKPMLNVPNNRAWGYYVEKYASRYNKPIKIKHYRFNSTVIKIQRYVWMHIQRLYSLNLWLNYKIYRKIYTKYLFSWFKSTQILYLKCKLVQHLKRYSIFLVLNLNNFMRNILCSSSYPDNYSGRSLIFFSL